MSHATKVWTLGTEARKKLLQYTGCGLDDIWLGSGYDKVVADGEEAIIIRDLDGLHEAIGRSLVQRKKLLTGKEIRFLRLQMNLTQSKLARLVGCDAQQVARYEKGQNKMHGAVDRLLRMLYREHVKDPVFVESFLEAIDEMDGRMDDKQVFDETAEGWKAAA
jgi:DNA-binding transcriptional regulator YiaG